MNPTNGQDLPSALKYLEQIKGELRTREPAVFLDYDGTLTPIVNRPEDARLSDVMRKALERLASLCTVAIISGRDRSDVARLVGLGELIYAGSHGFDITGPDGLRMEYEGGRECLPDLDDAERELRARIEKLPGAQVERKRFAVAVHYRNVAGKDVSRVVEEVDEVSPKFAKLKKGSGKKVIELKPDIDWDKGRAVLWLLERLGLDHPDILPFYVGDDLTDEDAFRALADRGIGILVGEHGEKTCARFRLNDVSAMRRFLEQLVDLLQMKRSGAR